MTTNGRVVLACVNDLHVGSPFALSPARWLLHDGNAWTPNELQERILAHWCACWQRIAQLRKGARLVVLVVGDVVEGIHHDTTQVVTARLDTQEAMSVACIETALKLAKFRRGDSIYFVSGTEAHDGAGCQSLERVARNVLCLDANDSHRATYNTLQRTVNGVRFDITHKPGSGPGSRAQTSGNAFQAWLKSLYLADLEVGAWPRYVLTAHYHVYLKRHVWSITNNNIVMTGYIMPSWKLADDYVQRVAPFGLCNVGMLAFDVTADGQVTEYDWRIPVEQTSIEAL